MIKAADFLTKRSSVWITRAPPGAALTAVRVEAIGLIPVVAPVLRFRAIAVGDRAALESAETLAFTSIQGARRAARLLPRRDVQVFAVGDATAQAARLAGFSRVASAKGDVDDLVRLILAARPAGGVLHPGALETAGDLSGALNAQGVECRKIAVYRTQSLSKTPASVSAALNGGTPAAILVHSPKAGRVIASLLSKLEFQPQSVTAFGLSEACLTPLKATGLRAMIHAAEPTEQSVIGALSDEDWKR